MPNLKETLTGLILEHLRAELADMKSYQKDLLDAASQETEENRTENREEELMQSVDQEATQLNALTAYIQRLEQFDASEAHQQVEYGALVETDHGFYLVAVPSPMIKTAEGSAIGISTDSPFYQQMQGLREGDTFTVNEMDHLIKAIH